MVIKNITKFDGKEIKKSIIDENMWNFTKRMMVIALFLLAGLFIFIFTFNNGKDSLLLTMGIGFMLFAVFSLLYNLFKLYKMKKNVDKDFEYEFTHGIVYDYSFHEEKFNLTITVGERTSKMELFYKQLKKILHYEEVIIFVLRTNDAYKCKKIGFESPKQEELFFFGLNKHQIKVTDKRKQNKGD